MIHLIAEQSSTLKTYKLCLDGKKINGSTTGILGDVDLFGHEQKPTLREKQNRLQDEILHTESVLKTLDNVDTNFLLQSFLPSIKSCLTEKLRKLVTLLSERLKDLRQMRVSKQTTLAKFKDIAGSNWKTSSLCNVISAISTHIYDLDACVKRTLNTVDGIIQVCAEMNACLEFCSESILDLSVQTNYRHLEQIIYIQR